MFCWHTSGKQQDKTTSSAAARCRSEWRLRYGGIGTVFWLTIFVTAQYPPPDFLETLRPIRERCANESGVGADAIRQFSDGESHDADSQLKCYMACMFEVSDVLGPDGDVHLETLYNRLPQSMKAAALKMGVPCLKIQGEGRCERAYYLHSCWKRSDPEHYFIVWELLCDSYDRLPDLCTINAIITPVAAYRKHVLLQHIGFYYQ